MDQEEFSLHQAPTIGPITKISFFVFFCIALGTVGYRFSGILMNKTYPGMVVGYEVEIAPKVGGKIVGVRVEKNMPIEKGQVLVELMDETLDVEIEAASAELTKLQDTVFEERSNSSLLSRQFDLEEKQVEVESTLDALEIDLEQLVQQIRMSEEAMNRAEDRLGRAQILLDQRAITRSQYESYQLEIASASSSVADLRLELKEKEKQRDRLREMSALYDRRKQEVLVESNERLVELELEIQKKEGEIQTLLSQKESLIVRADQSGVVSRDPRSVGEIVASGQPILYISTGERFWVEASLPATDIDGLNEGDPVEILAEKSHAIRMTGRVTGTLPILRTESRSSVGAFEDRNKVAVVMIEFDNPEEAKTKLRNGQSVIVRRISPPLSQ